MVSPNVPVIKGLDKAITGLVAIVRHEFPDGWSMLKAGELVGLDDDQLKAMMVVDDWMEKQQ